VSRFSAPESAGDEPLPKHHLIADMFGWYGMVAIVSAYLLVSIGTLSAHGLAYQLLNLSGAISLIWISWLKGVFQGVIINVFWVAIAMVGLAQGL